MSTKQKLLGFENAKTSKGTKYGYLTGILYLAPASLSGVNLCPKSSAGCRESCLFTAGRGRFASVHAARMKKTKRWLTDRQGFVTQLKYEIEAAIKQAARLNLKLAIRLNGTSDIVWESVTDIIQSFPDVQFYDYTKIIKRLESPLPANYDLTFSLSETNYNDAVKALSLGFRVAAVFNGEFSAQYLGYPVVSGDDHDLRFLDPVAIIGLKAKGLAKKDSTGFVIENERKVA